MLDKHLSQILQTTAGGTYGILFLTIFCETGLVVTPFLRGIRLLFLPRGGFGGHRALDPHLLFLLLATAGCWGNMTNYSIGRFVGPKGVYIEEPLLQEGISG